MANVTAIHKEKENVTKLNRTRAKQRGIQKSKEVEQESDKAGSDGREPETDDEAAGKDKTTAEGSGSGLEDSDNEHERGTCP